MINEGGRQRARHAAGPPSETREMPPPLTQDEAAGDIPRVLYIHPGDGAYQMVRHIRGARG